MTKGPAQRDSIHAELRLTLYLPRDSAVSDRSSSDRTLSDRSLSDKSSGDKSSSDMRSSDKRSSHRSFSSDQGSAQQDSIHRYDFYVQLRYAWSQASQSGVVREPVRQFGRWHAFTSSIAWARGTVGQKSCTRV